MAESDTFRPEAPHRVSDPSLEEMLRRARDAHLGETADLPRGSHLTPEPAAPRGAPTGWLHSSAVLVLGIVLGVLATVVVVQAHGPATVPPGTAQTTATPTVAPPTPTSTPTPLPTATDTPIPTPTATPTPSPTPYPLGNIVGMAKAYYDQLGPNAGVDILQDVTGLAIQSQDSGQLTVCIAFDVAAIAAPGTTTGWGIRTFTLAPDSTGTWSVVQMGGPSSCNLS